MKHRKVAIVGAAVGFGKSMAMDVAAAGAEVHLFDKDPRVADVADAVRSRGGLAHHRLLDVCAVDDVAGVFAAAFGADALDGIPHVERPGLSQDARVINMSSVTAWQPGAMNPHYSAAKMAVTHLTKHLAQMLAPDRILVNSISPGTIHTEGWDLYVQQKAQREGRDVADVAVDEGDRVARSMPLGRLGAPAEVAAAVLFLASASSFMTGADLAIDGGKIKSL